MLNSTGGEQGRVGVGLSSMAIPSGLCAVPLVSSPCKDSYLTGILHAREATLLGLSTEGELPRQDPVLSPLRVQLPLGHCLG